MIHQEQVNSHLGKAIEHGRKAAQILQFPEALEELAPEGMLEPKPSAALNEIAALNEALHDLEQALNADDCSCPCHRLTGCEHCE